MYSLNIPAFDIVKFINIKKVDGWDVKEDDQKKYYLIKFKFENFKILDK